MSGYQYTRFAEDGSGLRGFYNCAMRRYWLPTGITLQLILNYPSFNPGPNFKHGGLADLQFAWLRQNSLVVWNGTGYTDNMAAVLSHTMVTPFWVRQCDCSGNLPIFDSLVLNQ